MAEIKKVDNKDASMERQILTGLIMDETVCKRLSYLAKPNLFTTPYTKRIAKWCLEYWSNYEKPIERDIQNIFEQEMDSMNDKESGFIADFLSELSTEYESADDINSARVVDNGVKFFKKQTLRQTSDRIGSLAENDDIDGAEREMLEYRRIEKNDTKTINPWTDEDAIKRAFTKSNECLFELPGKIGGLLNDSFTRDGFVALMAPEKRGKTWSLLELAKQAGFQRNNVAFFGAGDMSEDPMIMRWHVNLAGKSDKEKYCKADFLPALDCKKNQLDICKKKFRRCSHGLGGAETPCQQPEGYQPCTECQNSRIHRNDFEPAPWYQFYPEREPLSWREARENGEEFYKRRMVGKDFKMQMHPNDSLSVGMIDSQLDIWEDTENFIPDVIVIDYADILAGESSFTESRHVENQKWKRLRRLSMERHCLVITATQSDARSYDAKHIGMQHFSEDKRKFGHVTGLFALNQLPDEKEKGIMRIGWVVLREDDFNSLNEVHVLQNLSRGRPIVASY